VGWCRRILGCLVASCCVGCAAPSTIFPGVSPDELETERRNQRILSIQTYYSQLARLNNVAHRIAHAGRADCKDRVETHFGFSTVAPNDLSEKLRELATEAFGQDPGTSVVISVAEDSPAAKAGIAVGDQLVSFNGQRVPKTKPADWIALFLIKNDGQPVHVEVRRNGQTLTRIVPTVTRCSIPILLKTEQIAGAFTDGNRIVIHSNMLRVTQTDDELAAVIGHEFAHVTMGHLDKTAQNRTAGTIGGMVVDVGFALLGFNTGGAFMRGFGNAGAEVNYTNFEREADYVGAYYTARAGYDLAAAERIWRAMAVEKPASIFTAGLHPTSPERFLLMQKTKEEIAEKKRRNEPLIPEARPLATIATATPEATIGQ
jgi:membrane-associated protease RseP (regulator of RpoE activity)